MNIHDMLKSQLSFGWGVPTARTVTELGQIVYIIVDKHGQEKHIAVPTCEENTNDK